MSLETRELYVTLSNKEYDLRTQQLADHVNKVKALRLEKKTTAAKIKAQIEEAEAAQDELAVVVSERREKRPVECRWQPDYERSMMELVRIDTGEAVQQRSMTERERQRELFSVPGGAVPSPAEAIGEKAEGSEPAREGEPAPETDKSEREKEGDEPEGEEAPEGEETEASEPPAEEATTPGRRRRAH